MRIAACFVPVLLLVLAAGVSSRAAAQVKPDSVPPAVDSATRPPPKKAGLFGKLKNVAKDKTVQAVAKAAACTAVPGGAVIVSAVDAASSKGPAAKGAGPPACTPGLSVPGLAAPGLPRAASMPPALKDAEDAAAAAAMMQGMMQKISSAAPASGSGPSPYGMDALYDGYRKQLEAGKAVISEIEWLERTTSVKPGSEAGFASVHSALAAALSDVTGSFDVVGYAEDAGSPAAMTKLAHDRAALLVSKLIEQGVARGRLTVRGSPEATQPPRIEFVRRGSRP